VSTLTHLRESDFELPIGFAVILFGYSASLTYVLAKVFF